MGDFFIASIKMLVVPLIFFSLVSGVAAIGDLRKLGTVGWQPMLLFVVTGQIAVWLGLAIGTWFKPGLGLNPDLIAKGDTPPPTDLDWTERLIALVPQNPVQAMADVNVLQLITFALLIGIGILIAKEEGEPVTKSPPFSQMDQARCVSCCGAYRRYRAGWWTSDQHRRHGRQYPARRRCDLRSPDGSRIAG